MRRFLFSCVLLMFLVAGCGEDEPQRKSNYKEPDWDKLVAAKQEKKKPASTDQTAESYGGVSVTIAPQAPAPGDCVQAIVKGKPGNRTITWQLNGSAEQIGEEARFCLPDVQRGDVVTVEVGDENAGASASVAIGNTPPRVLDTTLELVSEGGDSYLVITPEVEDADEDYVTLTYQWLINNEQNEAYTEDRLPADAFQAGDTVQARITANDGYEDGPVYLTRDVNVPSAPPTFTSSPPTSFEAYEYTYKVEAVDPEGGALSYRLDEAPEGMTINEQTGEIVWPLKGVEPGEYSINIAVTDSDGAQSNQAFTLNLGEPKPVEGEE